MLETPTPARSRCHDTRCRRGRFDVVMVWAFDRVARSVKHFLVGPLGRAVVVIIGAIAELERNPMIEHVRAGMRRAKLEGRHIGRKALVLDRTAILRGRQNGQSLGKLAKAHVVSRTTIHRVLGEQIRPVTKGVEKPAA